MAIKVEDIKQKPIVALKQTGVRLVAFDNIEFKQVSTKNLVELNSKGKIPIQYLELGDLIFMGVYDAASNLPILSDSIGEDNQYYIVSVAGTQDLGSGSLTMNPDDKLIYFNNKWNLVPKDSELLYNDDFDI